MVVRKKIRELRAIQINSNGRCLNALNEDGSVWVYIGNNYGWRPMNMKAMTDEEAIEADRDKYEPNDFPDKP